MIKLSVIIPFRCESKSSDYLIHRLKELLESFPMDLSLEFMVVDSGSSLDYRMECQQICQNHGITYIYHDTFGSPFSIGACRDFGVQHAKGCAVSFLDVDLRVAPDFWQRLLVLMEAWGISKYKKSFLAIPCMYLTQEGTDEFLGLDNPIKFTDFYLRYLQGDKMAIENMALCSSVMVVDRIHYLSIGGHDLEFRGHGYEDFELYHRLLCEENIIPKTDDYYLDQKTWNTFTYKGFRSHLAMIGRPAMMMNLFVVHLWHPRPKAASFYSSQAMNYNRNIWIDKFKAFENTRRNPEPLPIFNENMGNCLFFAKWHNSPSASSIRDILPFFGNMIYIDENYFMDNHGGFYLDNFTEFLDNLNVTRIVFPNPYGNLARLAIYEWCRKNRFPFYCYDRGALPDSWFFDANGFNADSSSYSPEFWNKELTKSQENQVDTYLRECIFGSNFLEKQSDRIGGEALAHKLQIGSKKVLFVPLQRPSDTVIKYMAGCIQSYSRFIDVIDRIAQSLLPKGWVVLCKKHPLETETPKLQYAQYVPEDTHFIDLLEMADRVALINSGVGIYGMMLQKPTYIFGNAFYACDGLNKTVKDIDFLDKQSIEHVSREIIQGYDVDVQKMKRFLYYLIDEFYSFGVPKTISRKEKDGSLRTITTGIDFYQLRLDGNLLFDYEKTPRPQIPTSAPMFERYALDRHLQKKQPASPKPAPKPKPEPINQPKDVEHKSNGLMVGVQNLMHEQFLKIENSAVKAIAPSKMHQKYQSNREQFFDDAKNPLIARYWKKVGKKV